MKTYQTDICIIGAGLAGLACAYELLDSQQKIILVDRDSAENRGGLAKESFGGIMLVDTPYQRKTRIKDSPELALADWKSYAEFEEGDELCLRWAEKYCEQSVSMIMDWLHHKNVKFLSIVNWPERGWDKRGNSVPRWHITWGTGKKIIDNVLKAISEHPNSKNIQFLSQHNVEGYTKNNNFIVEGVDESNQTPFTITSEKLVIATGGVTGGNLQGVTQFYNKTIHPFTEILNGAHQFGDGKLHFVTEKNGGILKNLQNQWHYAGGIAHPHPKKEKHGLSLVPPRSALWLDSFGKRFSPPLVGNTDTSYLVHRILQSENQYSWLVLNKKIFLKELAVSGSEYMKAFINQSYVQLLKDLFFGNQNLWEKLTKNHPDVLIADDWNELIGKMNQLCQSDLMTVDVLTSEIQKYNESVINKDIKDVQIKAIQEHRKYIGDRIRLCNNQTINDESAKPFVAIRCRIISRKSLGGIVTDLHSQVINSSGKPIKGLYAIGEAAGFGGGGIHGKRSLEGTFLGSCILTGRIAGQHLK